MAERYDLVYDGESINVNYKENSLDWACCDCGLVHRFEYYIEGDVLKIYSWRENRATAALRRYGKAYLFNGSDGLWKLVRRKINNAYSKGAG
jgi:hypothetical protein